MLFQPSLARDGLAARAALSEFPLAHGVLADFSDGDSGALLSGWSAAPLALAAHASHFGYVHSGAARIECDAGAFTLRAGMVFCIAGAGRISGPGCGIVIGRPGYRGMFQIGGPVEEAGRLKYIDGCTDSLLIPPVLKGDPCLNLLCFPPGTEQTLHTHPSVRIGIVVRGSGQCRVAQGRIPLVAGQVFVIHPEQIHAFSTEEEAMSVIAWHPDSDFGPTHENHPMINRTIVDGVPAAAIVAIRTR